MKSLRLWNDYFQWSVLARIFKQSNFINLDHPIMHYNIKSILNNYGFDDPNDAENIYLQLFHALKKAIIDRTLKEGQKLPPSRVLAKDLGISRSTVTKAYELLSLEKYVWSKRGSGIYVRSVKHKKSKTSLSARPKNDSYPKLSKRANSFLKNVSIKTEGSKGVAFRPGLPPLDIFPVQLWKNLSNNYWKTISASKLSYSNCHGLEPLRLSIAHYLKMYRGINCDPEQIIVTTGSLHSLSLVADALINKNDGVLIENPTYPYAYSLFKSLKARLTPVGIDEEGMAIHKVNPTTSKLVYTTPSHQYPSGIKMSLDRRLQLLQWASENSTFIIEDDYDHEFSNWDKPISSLFSLDREDRTVYLGTFNKLLHPSIRVGYMLVPRRLKKAITALYWQSSRFVAPATQTVLSYFIEKDYLNRHLRKVIEVSKERKAFFIAQFTKVFEDRVQLDKDATGLHMIGKLAHGLDDATLSRQFKAKGIIAHPYSSYFIDGTSEQGLVMGYSSVKQKVITETIYRMGELFKTA